MGAPYWREDLDEGLVPQVVGGIPCGPDCRSCQSYLDDMGSVGSTPVRMVEPGAGRVGTPQIVRVPTEGVPFYEVFEAAQQRLRELADGILGDFVTGVPIATRTGPVVFEDVRSRERQIEDFQASARRAVERQIGSTPTPKETAMHVGTVVVYVAPESERSNGTIEHPAIVTRVWGEGPTPTVNLTVFPDCADHPVVKTSVQHYRSLPWGATGVYHEV